MQLNVLRTESKADLVKLLADAGQDFEPTDFMGREYVNDTVSYTWDMMRYGRVETGILNNALRTALVLILNEIRLPYQPSVEMAIKRAGITTACALVAV